MDPNANSGASGTTDTSSVTAIKVQVVLDTTTEQLKKQFVGIQTDIEKDPIGLTFGVDKKTSKDAIIKGLQEILGNGTNITIGAGIDHNAGNQVKKQVQNVANAGQQAADKNNVKVTVDTKTEDAKRKLDAFYSRIKEQGTLQKASIELDFSKKNETELKWLQKQLSDVGKEAEKLKTELGDLIPQGDYTKLSELERSVQNSTDRIKAHVQGLKDSAISEINNGLSQAYTKYGKAQSSTGNSQNYNPFINVDTSAFNKVKSEYDALNDSLYHDVEATEHVEEITDKTRKTIESMVNSGIDGVREYGKALRLLEQQIDAQGGFYNGQAQIRPVDEFGNEATSEALSAKAFQQKLYSMSANFPDYFNYSATLDLNSATFTDFNKLVSAVNASTNAEEDFKKVQQEALTLHSQIVATIPSEIKTYDDLTKAVKAYYYAAGVDKLAGTFEAGNISNKIAPYTLFDNATKDITRSFNRLSGASGSEADIREMANLLAGLRGIDIPKVENSVKPTAIQESLRLVQEGLDKLSQLTKGTAEYDATLGDVTQKWQESVALMKATEEAEKTATTEAEKRASVQAKYGISQFNDEMTKYGKLSMDQLALSYKNGGSSKELTAVDSLENESRENLEKLKDYLAGILPQDQLDAVLQRYDNFERELSDKLYRAKQHYEDLKNARESTKATAEEKRQAKQTDDYTNNLATARNKYKNMSGVPADVSNALDNVDAQIKKLDMLKVGTEDYANQLKVIGTAWTDATRQMDAFDEVQKKTENRVKSMTEQAQKWKESIKDSEIASQELRDSIDGIINASKKLDSDHSSDTYKQGVKDLDDAFISTKASMSVYTDGYKDLESTATKTLTEIRKKQLELQQAGNHKFDNILTGDSQSASLDGSLESQFNYLKRYNSQSADYKQVLEGIVEEWKKIKIEIDQALKSEEDLEKEADKRKKKLDDLADSIQSIENQSRGAGNTLNTELKKYVYGEKWQKDGDQQDGILKGLREKLNTLSGTTDVSEYKRLLQELEAEIDTAGQKVTDFKKRFQESGAYERERKNLNNLVLQIDKYAASLSGLDKRKDLAEELNSIRQAAVDGTSTYSTLSNLLSNLQIRMEQAGISAETLSQKLSRLFKEHFQTAIAMAGVVMVKQGLREVYNNVVEIDDAMVELRKVTNESENAYSQFSDRAAKTARDLGASISDYISATADWSRLGYNMPDAEELARVSTLLKNVGDGIESVTDASSYMTSVLKGFDLVAEDAQKVADLVNEVANNEPASAEDILEILTRSGAALHEAGNDLDQAVALGVAMNSVTQNAESTGQTLKTVSMYLRAAKTDLTAMGESTDGCANSVSELRSELKKLTGVDIMADAAGTQFKSTYDILMEISKVWGKLTDVDRANVTELLGGKRNANSVSAVLSQFQIAEKSMKDAANSAGSAAKENEVYLTSITGKLNQLDSAFQQFSKDLLDSSLIKFFVDFATGAVDLADGAVKAAGALPTLTAAISGVLSVMQMSGKLKNGAGKVNMPSYICCV